MSNLPEINIKALIFGAAIAAAFIIFGFMYWDWFYPFSAIGLLYAGYGQKDLKMGTILGALASTPIIVLTFQGYMGQFSGFFLTENGVMALTVLILVVGAFVGFVGAWTKKSRLRAMEQYEKKQNIGKNKTKKKKGNVEEPKKGLLGKLKK